MRSMLALAFLLFPIGGIALAGEPVFPPSWCIVPKDHGLAVLYFLDDPRCDFPIHVPPDTFGQPKSAEALHTPTPNVITYEASSPPAFDPSLTPTFIRYPVLTTIECLAGPGGTACPPGTLGDDFGRLNNYSPPPVPSLQGDTHSY